MQSLNSKENAFHQFHVLPEAKSRQINNSILKIPIVSILAKIFKTHSAINNHIRFVLGT